MHKNHPRTREGEASGKLVLSGWVYLTRRIAIPCFLLALLSACASLRPPTINKQKAIEIGTDTCKIQLHGDMVIEPQNIRARLTTLGEADRLTRPKGAIPADYDQPLSTRVWFVQMDGQFQPDGFPFLTTDENGQIITPAPPKPWWGTCTVVLDANTGDTIITGDVPK